MTSINDMTSKIIIDLLDSNHLSKEWFKIRDLNHLVKFLSYATFSKMLVKNEF